MEKMIYFDMDGTINNFYQDGWLEDIIAENPRPYEKAPCVVAEEILLKLVERGYKLGIISWLAKGATEEYNKAVRKAKKEWLKIHYPQVVFTEIHIVKYGTPKQTVAKIKNAYLFDDEERNRIRWKGIALEPKEIYNF